MTKVAGFLTVLFVATCAAGVVAAGCDIPGALFEGTIIGNGEKQHLHAIGIADANKELAGRATVEIVVYRVTATGEETAQERLASGSDVYTTDDNRLFVKAGADIQLKKGEQAKIKVIVGSHEATAATVALYLDGKCVDPSPK